MKCSIEIIVCEDCPYLHGDGISWICEHPDSPIYRIRNKKWWPSQSRKLWCRLKEGELIPYY